MGIELQSNAGGVGGVHIDRNVIDLTNSPTNVIAISDVTKPAGSSCSTIWGNNIIGIFASGQWGIELDVAGPASMDIQQNVTNNVNAPFFFANATSAGVQNNTASNFNGGGWNNYAYNQDGGYNNTQWIGTNTLNGASVTGWTGHPNSGSQPAACAPSPVFPPG
jgi:hypothetical protein